MKLKFLKLRSLKLMLLLFILPLQMLAAELGEAGKLLAQFFFGEADFFSAKRLFFRAARDVSGAHACHRGREW